MKRAPRCWCGDLRIGHANQGAGACYRRACPCGKYGELPVKMKTPQQRAALERARRAA